VRAVLLSMEWSLSLTDKNVDPKNGLDRIWRVSNRSETQATGLTTLNILTICLFE